MKKLIIPRVFIVGMAIIDFAQNEPSFQSLSPAVEYRDIGTSSRSFLIGRKLQKPNAELVQPTKTEASKYVLLPRLLTKASHYQNPAGRILSEIAICRFVNTLDLELVERCSEPCHITADQGPHMSMRMRRIALVLLFAALPIPCRSQFVPEQAPGDAVSREVVSSEKLAWERAKKKDKAGLAELLAQDFTEIIDDGVFDRAQILTYLDHITLNSYSPSALKVKRIAPDAVLLIYQVSESGKYDDHPFQQTVNVASLWMKRGEQWQNVLFQETPVPN